jgi:hypothetical protein
VAAIRRRVASNRPRDAAARAGPAGSVVCLARVQATVIVAVSRGAVPNSRPPSPERSSPALHAS